jgi:serpin B
MRHTLRMAVPVLAGMILAAGCGSAATPGRSATPGHSATPGRTEAPELSADLRPYGEADAAFGLDLLGAWCRQDPDANIVFSPESLATGLGMAYLGARGSTARAMASVLGLPMAGQSLIAGLRARSTALRSLDGPGVTLATSDQVWADPSLPTLPGYLDALTAGYGASLRKVPLLDDPADAARQIDAAVAAATRGHIPHLLTAGGLNGSGWVLTDALYLDADWATPFSASKTAPGEFTTATGQHVVTSYLNGGGFPFTSADGWTAVSLPYRGGKLAMLALLPDSGSAGCSALGAASLTAITSALARGSAGRTAVALPKVSLQSRASLRGLLTTLGMGVAFSSDADFAGLSPSACCIGMVVHAATLDVGEKGTVGSAATAVGIQPTAATLAPRQLITFDRPYLLLVTDTSTGEPLFLARVTNPTQ